MTTSSSHGESDVPFVSVVMPVCNEARFITRSVQAVLAQDYPGGRLEIIVADGLSQDGTAEAVRALQAGHANLKLIENPGRIAATALNRAIAQARGEIIIRVDGHCEIAPSYVRNCVRHLQAGDASVAAVGGPLTTVGETAMAETIAVAMSSAFGVGGSPFRTGRRLNRSVDTVAFPAMRRSAVQRAGSFDEELVRNQDDDYSYRLRSLGYSILLADDVQVRYYSRGTLGSLWRQYFQYGYWKVRVLQKNPRQACLRQFAPPLFAATLALAAMLAPFVTGFAWMLSAMVAAYALAALLGAMLTAAARGWRHAPLLPFCFAILHLSYGFGFLWGLICFRGRWRERPLLAHPGVH